ncbi:MAG: hypothetical protein J5594_04925 [Elusimicrobiaceae bacterium]|nr:hypothetical protein [Elusimicrobiaceae bacterium]
MLSTLFNFVLKPSSTINQIMQERKLKLAIFGYCTGAFSIVLARGLTSGIGIAGFIFYFITILFFNVCISFFFSATAHLFLELTTGRGRATGLFVLLGISEFAKTLLVAFSLIALNLPVIYAFKGLFVFAILLLQLFFVLYMMKHAYGLNKTMTFFALIISFVPSIICFFATIFILISAIFWLIFA